MLKKITLVLIFVALVFMLFYISSADTKSQETTWWKFQSIDTMKYSRDIAREKLSDSTFDLVINDQVRDIAETGATHIAIATPYDEEFYPFLKKWVDSARSHGLSVWFRGNFSGWEGWFGYRPISRSEHLEMTDEFIRDNTDLFENGDVFTACPECENGGPGDPRFNGDVKGHREFLIDEYAVTSTAFRAIRKRVSSNYNSMNMDVARLIMNRDTTKALGGLVVIDHYVKTPEQLNADITELAKESNGKIILGEVGIPIPDIHGELTEAEQAEWLSKGLTFLAKNKEVAGINYWVGVGGSTALWNEEGGEKEAVEVLKNAYSPGALQGTVKNAYGRSVEGAIVESSVRKDTTLSDGAFLIPTLEDKEEVSIRASGYKSEKTLLVAGEKKNVVLTKEGSSFIESILKYLQSLFS